MGLILDIVPNHVAVGGSENPWWQDVLARGRQSAFAEFFDIDWESPDPLLTGRVLLPFLGGPYRDVLDSGELVLRYRPEPAGFDVEYHEHRFPIDPAHYGDILRQAEQDDEHEALQSLAVLFDTSGTHGDSPVSYTHLTLPTTPYV